MVILKAYESQGKGRVEKTWCGDGNNTISWSALWPRTTKWDALAWIRGHQYGRGDSFGTKMVNENKALSRKRRRGPTKMNGGKTYAFSWLARSWAKTLTPREPGVWKGVKWGSGEPEHPIWALESSAIKSKVCGPKRFSNSFHGQACNPYQTKSEREHQHCWEERARTANRGKYSGREEFGTIPWGHRSAVYSCPPSFPGLDKR